MKSFSWVLIGLTAALMPVLMGVGALFAGLWQKSSELESENDDELGI